jgi:WD40 repeat protein
LYDREPPAPREPPLPAVDGYEILGELGRGGMGVVYRARHVLLNRPCVLKMILAGDFADARAVARFRVEAEAEARLHHPNIVQIYHVGEVAGRPFFELEYVEGGSLDRQLDGTPWTPRRAAELVEALARGIAEAHRHGIVHRDLKPGNVLLAADGTPKITDFGLAKSLAGDSNLTQTGAILGSPDYMAPEQAEGKTREVGPLADVYALGAMLYELLTGRPPFRAATMLETLELVRTAEPVPLSRLVPGLPRDVETIALKCLQKEPGKRYDSASALAEDLRRLLGGEPIAARRIGRIERAWRWCRRHPVPASLTATIVLVAAMGLAAVLWQWGEAVTARDNEARHRLQAEQLTEIANQRAEDLAWEDYINRVNRAYREVQDNNVALAEDLLHGCPSERRGWEWHFINRLCHHERLSLEAPAGCVYAIAYSPDGRRIATATGGPFSVGKGSSNVELWDRETGQRQMTVPGTEHHVWSLAFSPDGTKLAVGGRSAPNGRPQVMVLVVKTGEVLWTRHEPSLPQAMSIAFNPDGKSLAVGFGEYSGPGIHPVKLYDVASGRETATLPGPKGGVNSLAFHPDGRRLAVAGSELVEVWEVVARTRVHELRGHSNWVYRVAFSPDGKWLASGGWDNTIKLRDAATGAERLTIFAHEGFVLDLAFSPDSRSLASSSEDRSIRLWEVPSGRRLGVFHGHTDFVQAVAFTPDGRELASGGLEGTLKVWDRRTSLPVVIVGISSRVKGLWYPRDGRRIVFFLASPVEGQEISKSWDLSTGELGPTMTGIDRAKLGDEYVAYPAINGSLGTATSADARLHARVVRNNANLYESPKRSKSFTTSAVEVRDRVTGSVLHTLLGHSADVVSITFSPDGRRIATASFDRTVKLWDTATGREVFTLRGHTAGVEALGFSHDGHRIVSSGIEGAFRVWDATPLPAEVLRAQEAHYQQKQAELKALRDRTEAE